MNLNIKKRRIPKIIVIALALILALFILNFFRSPVKNFFYLVSSPVQKLFWKMGDNVSALFNGSLEKEISDLRQKNQELLDQLSLLDQYKKENEDLRTALGLNLQKDFKMVFSQIISKDASEDSILIDKGAEDGIAKDMPAIDRQKVLFGKVSEVYNNFSRVVLISDKSSVFDAKVGNKEIYGVVKGEGGLNLYFDLVSRDADLQINDVLTTSVLGGKFPNDLLVGEIQKINKEDIKPFQTADIKPFFDLSKTDDLFIITNFKR